MQKNKKRIEQLKNLKIMQQQKSMALIVKIEQEKTLKQEEIDQIELKIGKLYQQKKQIRQDFYASIKKGVYQYKDVMQVDFDIQKVDFDIERLKTERDILVDELQQIADRLSQEKLVYKSLIVKEEKYNEFIQRFGN